MIRLENISFTYPPAKENHIIFSNLSLRIRKGEWIVLTGGSGSGKTTLLKLIKGIIDPTSGKIFVHGKPKETNHLLPGVAYLGSNPENQIISTIVEDEVLFGLQFVSGDDMRAKSNVDFLLGTLGLLPLKYYFTSRLSGGEQQKLLLASHLALNPSVVLLDNALCMVDPDGKEKCLQLLKMLQKSGCSTIIMVDFESDVISWADRVIHLENGRVLFS